MRRQAALPATLAVLAAATLAGCPASTGRAVRSDQPRAEPDVDDAAVAAITSGQRAFALDLYQRLAEAEDGNLFWSPHSVHQALAMVAAGARGETAAELQAALRLRAEDHHPAQNALDQALASRSGGGAERFTLEVANAVWAQDGFPFEDAFLDLLATQYGAALRAVDFGQRDAAAAAINAWVADRTDDMIPKLVDPSLLESARLVLTNAVYFDAAWAHPFEPEATDDGPFHRLGGEEVEAALMRQDAFVGYAEGDGWQAIEKPYAGGEVAMAVVLPEEGRFREVEGGLTGPRLDAILAALQRRQVALTLPKFETRSRLDLEPPLKAVGLERAFDPDRADLTGISSEPLFVGAVVHEAVCRVDEEGTEAAAATAVSVDVAAAPADEPVVFRADRPFLFLIRDVETGAVLFLGRILDPTG